MFSAIPYTLNNTKGPPLVMLEVLSRKVMALGEKAELLDMYCRLKSAVRVACHFKMNESNVRIIVKTRKGNP